MLTRTPLTPRLNSARVRCVWTLRTAAWVGPAPHPLLSQISPPPRSGPLSPAYSNTAPFQDPCLRLLQSRRVPGGPFPAGDGTAPCAGSSAFTSPGCPPHLTCAFEHPVCWQDPGAPAHAARFSRKPWPRVSSQRPLTLGFKKHTVGRKAPSSAPGSTPHQLRYVGQQPPPGVVARTDQDRAHSGIF